MAFEPEIPGMLGIPFVPEISDLLKMSRREIEIALLAACPERWHDVFKAMLDSAHLYSHDLNLPRLVADLMRIRDHETEIRCLQNADDCMTDAASMINMYAMMDSGPDNPRLRGAVEEVMRIVIREELSGAGHTAHLMLPRKGSVYFKKEDGLTMVWTGEGSPESGPGEWVYQKFILVRSPENQASG
jgi:hypothetical protein